MRWEQITTALELFPRIHRNVGEPRTTPTGTPLGGIHKNTYCSFQIVKDKSDALIEALTANVSRLEAHRDFLNEFVASGGTIEYDVAWFMADVSSEETLPLDLIGRMADLNIELGFDVYGRG
jgi:hypothetical protein